MKTHYQLIAAIVFTAIALTSCTNGESDHPGAHSGTVKKGETKEFKLFNIPEEDIEQINSLLDTLFIAQNTGNYRAAVEMYLPGIVPTDNEKQIVIDQMGKNKENGIVQTFEEHELLWVSPYFDEPKYKVCFAMVRMKHEISVGGKMADKFDVYQVNVGDMYGKQYVTKDAENNRYLIDGPAKFFFFKMPDGAMHMLNEEVLRSPIAKDLFDSMHLRDMKDFETTARKATGY